MIDPIYKSCTRELTINDITSIIDVIELKNHISKLDKSLFDKESFSNSIQGSLNNKQERIVGYFEKDKLISFLVQVVGIRIPAWHMTMLATCSDNSWNYKKNGLEYCWANAMDYAENLGIYRIYWSLPSVWERTQKKTYNTTDVWNRYSIFIEDKINSNEFPKWEEHKISFGNKLKPHSVTVKQAILKNEYRRFSN